MENITALVETKISDNKVTLKNQQLEARTNHIIKLMNSTKKNLFEIAVTLDNIKNTPSILKDDGFEDVFDYANKVLGYKKATVYAFTRVASKFIIENSEGEYISIFESDDTDYSIGQLQEMVKLDYEQAVELDESGAVNKGMTTKEIRQAVKTYMEGGNETEETNETKETEETENNEFIDTIDEFGNDYVELIAILDRLMTNEEIIKRAKVFSRVESFRRFADGDLAKALNFVTVDSREINEKVS